VRLAVAATLLFGAAALFEASAGALGRRSRGEVAAAAVLFTGLGVAATTAFATPPTPEALSGTACVFRKGLGRRACWAPADAPAFEAAVVELLSSLPVVLEEAAGAAGLPGPAAAACVIVFDEGARFMRRAFFSASSFACLRLSSISLASRSAELKPLVLPGIF